jgi:DNA-binding NarL/FixJ family response regulator
MKKIDIGIVCNNSIINEGISYILESITKINIAYMSHEVRDNTIQLLIFLVDEKNSDFDFSFLDKNTPILYMFLNKNIEIEKVNFDNRIHGVLTLNTSKSEIIESIDSLLSGKRYYSSEASNMVFLKFLVKSNELISENLDKDQLFSSREREIIKLVMQGMSSKEIGDELNISKRTVEKHRSNCMIKANVNSSIELIEFTKFNNIKI